MQEAGQYPLQRKSTTIGCLYTYFITSFTSFPIRHILSLSSRRNFLFLKSHLLIPVAYRAWFWDDLILPAILIVGIQANTGLLKPIHDYSLAVSFLRQCLHLQPTRISGAHTRFLRLSSLKAVIMLPGLDSCPKRSLKYVGRAFQ